MKGKKARVVKSKKSGIILTPSKQQLTASNRQIIEERDYFKSIIGTIREPFLVLNKELRVVSANRSFYDTFKVKKIETERKLI